MRGALTAVAALAATGGLAAAGTLLPVGDGATVPTRAVAVAAGDTLLACPGPPLLSGGTDTDQPSTDEQFEADPVETATAGWLLAPARGTRSVSTFRLPDGSEDGARARPVQVRHDVSAGSLDADGTSAVRAVPAGDAPAPAGGLVTAVTAGGDLRGLAAGGCTAPASQSWLVGGGTDVGRSARLVLANPGRTVVTVDLAVLTAEGTQSPAGGRGLVVPAGERREVLLEGLVPNQPGIAVQVSADGGRVAAFLHDSVLHGLVPGGVDVVGPAAAPSVRQLVTGVRHDPATTTTLRLVNPGSDSAVVSWRLLGDGGQRAPAGQAAATVPAGSLVDVELAGLPEGTYTAVVESETPVTAAALLQRRGDPPEGGEQASPVDLAWAASVEPLTTAPAVLPLPRGEGAPVPTLLLGGVDGADAAAEVTLQVVAVDGRLAAARTVQVPAGRTLRLAGDDLAPDGALGVLLSARAGDVVPAGLLLGAGDGRLVSVVAVPPGPVAPAAVAVRQAPAGSWPQPGS